MNAVSGTTSSARRKPRLVAETTPAPHQPRRISPPGAVAAERPSWVAVRLRAALTQSEQPVRARSLAYDLGLSSAEVTAELRHLQDLGVATSRDRRWTVATADLNTAPERAPAAPRRSA
jgi:biotin operon repressor